MDYTEAWVKEYETKFLETSDVAGKYWEISMAYGEGLIRFTRATQTTQWKGYSTVGPT